MDYERLQPWLVVLGYLAAFALLWLGRRTGRPASRFCYSAAGLLVSVTTLFWFTDGRFDGPWVVLWTAVPLAVTALIWWRTRRQREWMTDLVASIHGVTFDGGEDARPSFGVVPPRFQVAVEVRYRGRRLLGVQYVQAPSDALDPDGGPVVKVVTMANSFTTVQLSTSPVPTLVVRPRTARDRHREYGPLEGGPVVPGEDAELARNTTATLRLAAQIEPFRLGVSAEFDKYFAISTAEPEFARAVLTDEVVAFLLREPGFRVTETVFDQGTLRCTTFGQLTERGLFDAADRLAALTDLIVPATWEWPTAARPHE